MKNKHKLFVKTHLGMGDQIVHNGMIREIADQFPDYQIFTSAKSINFSNVVFMYRDDSRITVIEEGKVNEESFDRIISSHTDDNNLYTYDDYFDDSFYFRTGINPEVKTKKFKLIRDPYSEEQVFKKLIEDRNLSDYLFIHEKETAKINLDRVGSSFPIVTADPKYGIFDLLKVIENAKGVHVISSSFLCLFMCKKFNPNTFAHMYSDRSFISPYVMKHNIEVII